VEFTCTYQGMARYLSEAHVGGHRLLVAVPCQVGDLPPTVYALLDTAAEWCVLPEAYADAIGYQAHSSDPPFQLHSRLGLFSGRLCRLPLTFPAEDGEALTIQATFLICPDWPGPVVIGWKGCLERLRFALEPDGEALYFGSA